MVKKNLQLLTIAAILFSSLVIGSLISLSSKRSKEWIVFFCGAGMKVPASEIAAEFEELYGIPVVTVFEGSSILRKYIETYGGVDVFLSGDQQNIDLLVEKGLIKKQTFIAWHIPSILVPPEKKNQIRGLEDIAREGTRLVMSNPTQASLGKLVHATLLRYPKGKQILDNVVVYGSSTQDDLKLFWDLYKKKSIDAVIEWDVMACTPEGKNLVVVPFEKEYEIRTSLTLGLLNTTDRAVLSERFYTFVKKEGLNIFKSHCYTIK